MAGRDHSWDALRALLMLLGVPFHAMLPYSYGVNAVVISDSPSIVAEILGNTLHTFRMAAFFVVAGYFAALSIERKGSWTWWRGRWLGLAPPLLAGLICFIPVLMLIRAIDYSDGNPDLWAAFNIIATTPGRHSTSHLWFLIVLLQLCLLIALSWNRIRGYLLATGENVKNISPFLVASLIMPLVLLPLIILSLSGVDQNGLAIILDIRRLFEYAPFFFLGTILHLSPQFLQEFTRFRPTVLIGSVVAVIVYVACDLSGAPMAGPLALASKAVAGTLIAGLLIGSARRFFSHPKPIFAWLASAAFTIYLFHHPIVFATAYLLEETAFVAEMRIAIIVVVALAASCLIHLAISRSAVLLFIFNGRSPRSSQISRTISVLPNRLPGAEKPN